MTVCPVSAIFSEDDVPDNLKVFIEINTGWYKDKDAAADGITQVKLKGGDAGKGQVKVQGKNSSGNLPTGVVAGLLNNPSGATVQVLSSNGACFSLGVTDVKKADATAFTANGP